MTSQEKIHAGETVLKVTRLIIEKEEGLKALGVHNNVTGQTRQLSIGRNTSQEYDYYRISNFSRTQKLQVFMRAEDGLREIKLPEELLERMATYLRRPPEASSSDNDCREFVQFLHGVPFDAGTFYPDKWKWFQLADESHLRAGDAVCITKAIIPVPKTFADIELKHFAIYLDSGLYISRVGKGADLIVTDLDSMKNIYEGDQVYVIIPETDPSEKAAK